MSEIAFALVWFGVGFCVAIYWHRNIFVKERPHRINRLTRYVEYITTMFLTLSGLFGVIFVFTNTRGPFNLEGRLSDVIDEVDFLNFFAANDGKRVNAGGDVWTRKSLYRQF